MYRAVLKTQPDRALASLAADGSEPAFEVIVLRYRRPLLGYCRRLALSDNRSEDVVQQTFINAWGSLRRGTDVQDLRAWLYRITHNQAVSMLRGAGSDDLSLTELLDAPPEGVDLLRSPGSVEEIFERQTRLRETLAAVADLPALQREALMATAVDGLSYEQVAVALNTSGDAVRGLVYRARNSLRAGIAVISPSPVVVWAAERAGQPVSATAISQWMTEAAAGGGSIGLSAAAIKSAAVVASSAVVVTGTVSTGLDRQVFGAHHATSARRNRSAASSRQAASGDGHAALAAVSPAGAGGAASGRGALSRSAASRGGGGAASGSGLSGARSGRLSTTSTGSDGRSGRGSGGGSGGSGGSSGRSGVAPFSGTTIGGGSAMAISQPLSAPPEEMRMRPADQPASGSGPSGQGDGTGQAAGTGSSSPSASGSGSSSGSASSGATSSTSTSSGTSTTTTTPTQTTTGGETTTTPTTPTSTTTSSSTTAASS